MLLILFMYIFSFPLFKGINETGSNFVIGFILFLYVIVNKRYREIIFSIIKKKAVLRIYLMLTLLTVYSFSIPIVLGTNDFSILISFISQFFILFIGILVFGYYQLKDKQNEIPYHLIYIFVLQGVIQLISLLFPAVNIFLNNFRTESAINIGQLGFYDGARGLSLSGQAFYGLGVGYGLIFILLLDKWKTISPKHPFLKIIYLGILVFGATSAARSSLVGLIIGLVYVFLKKIFSNKEKSKMKQQKAGKKVIILIISLPIVILIFIGLRYFIDKNPEVLRVWDFFVNYSLEFFSSFTQSGEFGTTSTNILFDRMYFPINDIQTIIFGDGFYTNFDGTYYMGTDAGYMRNILYFGVIGLISLLIYQVLLLDWKNKKNILLNFTIIVYILVIHIKGEALGFSIMLQSILFTLFLSQRYSENTKML